VSRDFECEERDIRTISDCESNDGVNSGFTRSGIWPWLKAQYTPFRKSRKHCHSTLFPMMLYMVVSSNASSSRSPQVNGDLDMTHD